MDPALLSIFVLLQLVLSPIMYPFGYVAQALLVLASGWRKLSLGEIELSLLETLVLVCLICNMVIEENITVAGYATRAGILFFRLYQSPRLQHLGMQIVEPVTSGFLLVELVASPHLYPTGYLAQLALIFFLALSGSLQMLTLLLMSSRKQFQKQFFQLFAVHSDDGGGAQSPGKGALGDATANGRRSPASRRSPATVAAAAKSLTPVARKAKKPARRGKRVAAMEALSLLWTAASWLLGLGPRKAAAPTVAGPRSRNSSADAAEPPARPPSEPSSPRREPRSLSTATAAADASPDDSERFRSVSRFAADSDDEPLDGRPTDAGDDDADGDGDELVEEDEPEDDLLLCKICFEGSVATAFVSCGHVCCRQCSDTLAAAQSRLVCPFCQAAVQQQIDLFFP